MPSEMFLYGQALRACVGTAVNLRARRHFCSGSPCAYADEEPHCQVEMLVRPELARMCTLGMHRAGRARSLRSAAEIVRSREARTGAGWEATSRARMRSSLRRR